MPLSTPWDEMVLHRYRSDPTTLHIYSIFYTFSKSLQRQNQLVYLCAKTNITNSQRFIIFFWSQKQRGCQWKNWLSFWRNWWNLRQLPREMFSSQSSTFYFTKCQISNVHTQFLPYIYLFETLSLAKILMLSKLDQFSYCEPFENYQTGEFDLPGFASEPTNVGNLCGDSVMWRILTDKTDWRPPKSYIWNSSNIFHFPGLWNTLPYKQ